MAVGEPFVDYYDVLQVHPTCEAKILESAYHYLAKRYHPDRTGTADATRFSAVIDAYRVLRNPDKRARYDQLRANQLGQDAVKSPPKPLANGVQHGALNDAADHARILDALYKKRRENAQNAGVIGFYLQEMLGCSDETFDFHKWYLKEKGFIIVT
jgi:curved DNA-binding protein